MQEMTHSLVWDDPVDEETVKAEGVGNEYRKSRDYIKRGRSRYADNQCATGMIRIHTFRHLPERDKGEGILFARGLHQFHQWRLD